MKKAHRIKTYQKAISEFDEGPSEEYIEEISQVEYVDYQSHD